MEFKVHTFATIEQANNAIDLINNGEGIPVNDSATTRTYATAMQHKDFWYIYADEVTEKYLGEGEIIEINNEEE